MSVENDKLRGEEMGVGSFGDLTPQLCMSDLHFTSKTSAPTTYVESTKGGTGESYSHQELDGGSYGTLISPV